MHQRQSSLHGGSANGALLSAMVDAGSGWTVAGDLPLADEVVLFGCFLGGYRETKATAGLFLWMDGGEIGLTGWPLEQSGWCGRLLLCLLGMLTPCSIWFLLLLPLTVHHGVEKTVKSKSIPQFSMNLNNIWQAPSTWHKHLKLSARGEK